MFLKNRVACRVDEVPTSLNTRLDPEFQHRTKTFRGRLCDDFFLAYNNLNRLTDVAYAFLRFGYWFDGDCLTQFTVII
jgi:hypothetical protein